MTQCPTCGQRIVKQSRRVCADCSKQITRHHKWFIGEDGRVRHRVCSSPDSYVAEPVKAPPIVAEASA